jgi:hypothetical protein
MILKMPQGLHQNLKVSFVSRNRKAECAPNSEYPNGVVIDTGERPACSIDLPYPAPCVGSWLVSCNKCLTTVMCTAAGRSDDPRAIIVPCKR